MLIQTNPNEEVAVAMGFDNLFFPSAFLVAGVGLAVAMLAAEAAWIICSRGGLRRTKRPGQLHSPSDPEKKRSTPERGLAFATVVQ